MTQSQSVIDLLRSIDSRLARVQQSLQLMQRQSFTPQPCCTTLETQPGEGLPILAPPTPELPDFGEPDACQKVAAMLSGYVDVWNYINSVRERWEGGGVALFFEIIKEQLLGNPLLPLLSYELLGRLYDGLVFLSGGDVTIDTDEIDWCTAVRQYVESGGIPQEILSRVPPLVAPLFILMWNLTGEGRWHPDAETSDLVDNTCCLPDTFQLLPVATRWTCGTNTYETDVISSSDIEFVSRLFVYTASGAVWMPRATFGGIWFRQIGSPGRFNLWLYTSPEVTDACIYTQPFDLEIPNLVWYLIEPGDGYITIRNRVSFEGVYLECVRNEPSGWNPQNRV